MDPTARVIDKLLRVKKYTGKLLKKLHLSDFPPRGMPTGIPFRPVRVSYELLRRLVRAATNPRP